MVNFLTGIFGIAAVTAFLGVMLWWVPAPPLIIIVVVVLGLLLYDFVKSLRAGNNNGGSR